MKVLTGIDIPFRPSSGSIILCDDIYAELGNRGHSIRFIALNAEDEMSWSKMKDVVLVDVKKNTGGKGFDDYTRLLETTIRTQIRSFKPDILHVHHLTFGMATAFSNIADTVPKLAFCHGSGLLFAMDEAFHHNNIQRTFRCADATVFPTRNVLDAFEVLAGDINRAKCHVIPWGIPDHLVSGGRPRVFAARKQRKLLYAGRLDANKGLETLIKALPLITSDVHLEVFGEGEEKADIVTLIHDLGLSRQVELKRPLSRLELWRRFAEFDCLVIPTRRIEAFSLLAVEAQAHGLPVVAANTNGVQEVIATSGKLFESDSHHHLARNLNELVSQPDQLTAYSQKSIRNAEKFQISNTVDRLLALSANLRT